MRNYRISNSYSNLLKDFDEDEQAIINPFEIANQVNGFPERLVLTFTRSIVEKWALMEESKVITHTESANGREPVYVTGYKDRQVAFAMAPVGASACTGILEDLIALGARKIVVFGSCGVLDKDIAESRMVIPREAIRDEGTSYHYAPPSDSIFMDEASVVVLQRVMEDFKYPYVAGKTWTTDAIYRETRKKMMCRKEAGCIVVEMECAALIAAARFRAIKFAQFLYAADNLDSEEWEKRGLCVDQGLSNCEQYMQVALEAVLQL